jgi:hypothetical protein
MILALFVSFWLQLKALASAAVDQRFQRPARDEVRRLSLTTPQQIAIQEVHR